MTLRKISTRDIQHCHFLKSTCDIGDPPIKGLIPSPREKGVHTQVYSPHQRRQMAWCDLGIPRFRSREKVTGPRGQASLSCPATRGHWGHFALSTHLTVKCQCSLSEPSTNGGPLLGGPKCRISILRNDSVLFRSVFLRFLNGLMLHVDFKELPMSCH